MKITSGVAIRLGVLALVVSVGGWLVKNNWWPQGSDNMFVVTDGTPIQAVIVCADSGETLWRLVSAGGTTRSRSQSHTAKCRPASGRTYLMKALLETSSRASISRSIS